AALVILHALLRKHSRADWLLLGINVAAVIVSASKAAFLGLALFAAAMIFARKRRWLIPLSSLLLLLALTPNPLQRMVLYSLRHDPYVLNRFDIWNMSARMFRHNFWTGVGPDLFMDAAQRFNFSQHRGPARYFKLPESAHSDYWQIIAETGLPGLLLVFLALFFAIRRMLSPPWFTLPKLLLAFLLAQMLLINFVFNFFFLLVFFLLLQDFLSDGQRFITLKPAARLFFSMLLVFSLLVLYLFPFLAKRCLDEAAGAKDIARSFSLLQRAALLSPLDERPPLAKAEVLRFFAARTGNLDAWADAWASLHLAQRLNRNCAEAYIKEAALFHEFIGRKIGYPALGEEILRPLRHAERLRPFNPFLKMQQAVVYRESGRDAEARVCAQAALDLEPDYAEAIVFIHDLDGLPASDPSLQKRLSRIREKAGRLRARPGSYLSRLHQLPTAAPGK
ncbi:MAG: O-antigen ligase family protein, partial [Acidobacteria bacterium]|nr:O-antigen ligase family protein [Acidobacteriota bacterium]